MLLRKASDVALRFADDDDMLAFESKLDDGRGNGIWPRRDKQSNQLRDWDRYHQKGMNELGRRLRARKSTAEPFELGRLDPRSREKLRESAACFALHFLFVDADNSGDAAGFLARKSSDYWTLAGTMLDAEANELDYDADNSGGVDDVEKNQPVITRFIRG